MIPASRLREVLAATRELPIDEGQLSLVIDPRSYPADVISALAKVARPVGDVVVNDGIGRFSQVPVALLVLTLGGSATAAWWFSKGFFTRLGERMGEEVGDDLTKVYREFKRNLREMVSKRREPLDRPPITMFEMALPGPDGRCVTLEGSSRADDDELDAFLDAGASLLAVGLAYLGVVQEPERLVLMHFAWEDGVWRYRYGLNDEAERVMVIALSERQYAEALEHARDGDPTE